MLNTKTQPTEATPRFVFSPKSGEIKTPDGKCYEVNLSEAMIYLLEKSKNKHFNSLFNDVGAAVEVLLRSEIPDNVKIKEFQSIVQSLGVIEQFLSFLINEKHD